MGGLGILLFIAVRLLIHYQGKGTSPSPVQVRPSFLASALRWALFIAACVVLAQGGPLWVIALLAAAAVPNLLIDGLVIPSGVPGLAYVLTRSLRPPGVGTENYPAAVFNELRARLRRGWLLDEERLERLARPLLRSGKIDAARGASVAATAMLDALRGDFDHARPLFELSMGMQFSPRNVRCYSQAWLLADAGRRRDHVALLRFSRRGPRSFRRWFSRACAERLLGQKPHSSAFLWALWLLAPGRRHTLGLLRLALAQPAGAEAVPSLGEGLDAARDAARRLLGPSGPVSRERVRQAADAWQHCLDRGELRAWFETRAQTVDANLDVDAMAARVEQDVLGLLADTWQAAPCTPSLEDDAPELLFAANDAVRSRLLDEVEPLVSELPTGDQRSNGETEQNFRRWAEIRRLMLRYAELFPDDAELFYDSFGPQILNHGVWLTNRELAHSFGYDVFQVLSAFLPKEHESQELLKGNCKIAKDLARTQ